MWKVPEKTKLVVIIEAESALKYTILKWNAHTQMNSVVLIIHVEIIGLMCSLDILRLKCSINPLNIQKCQQSVVMLIQQLHKQTSIHAPASTTVYITPPIRVIIKKCQEVEWRCLRISSDKHNETMPQWFPIRKDILNRFMVDPRLRRQFVYSGRHKNREILNRLIKIKFLRRKLTQSFLIIRFKPT